MSNKCNCQIPNTDIGGRCFKCGGFVEMPISKPMTNEERIKADAEAYANGIGDVYRKYAAQYGYIAGATAEHDQAQVLVDALEKLAVSCQELFDVKNSTNKKNIKLNAWNDLAFKLRDAKNVLQQWKSGKGKEVGDE